MNEQYEPPEPTGGDLAHTVARAGLSAIPIVGGAASELFTAIVNPPLQMRRQSWMEEVGNALRRLEQKRGIRLEDLRQNETFIDTVMQASQAALSNSHEEKRRALRNAVINAALPNPPEASLQHWFLSLTDAFTEWHLRVLWAAHNPACFFGEKVQDAHRKSGKGLIPVASAVLSVIFPALQDKPEFADQIWNDLYTHGLVGSESQHLIKTQAGPPPRATTSLGDQFLRFIDDPL